MIDRLIRWIIEDLTWSAVFFATLILARVATVVELDLERPHHGLHGAPGSA